MSRIVPSRQCGNDRTGTLIALDGNIRLLRSINGTKVSAMQNLNDLFYFAQVVDHGGFAPAGRALGIPKSKLSRRIAALEAELGVQLLLRSTRNFSVTEIGQRYYAHCKAMLVEAEAAAEAIELSRSAPRGIVGIAPHLGSYDSGVGPPPGFVSNPDLAVGAPRDGLWPGVWIHR
jgi:hypothetical protein